MNKMTLAILTLLPALSPGLLSGLLPNTVTGQSASASVVVSLQPRLEPRGTLIWYALAGGLAILIGNPVVNYFAAVALLVGATRDFSCLVGMAVFAAVAGAVFACMRPPHRQIEYREPRSRPVVHT